jgi:hypothetical protein
MGVKGLFTMTLRHSSALTSVQGVINTHSKAFNLFISFRPNKYVFKYAKHTKTLYIGSQIPLDVFALATPYKKT